MKWKDIAQQSDAEHLAATWFRRDIRSQSSIFACRQAEQRHAVDHQETISPGASYRIQDLYRWWWCTAYAWRSEFSSQVNPVF